MGETHVFRQGVGRHVYREFRGASGRLINVPTFARRLRLDLEKHPEHVEAVAYQMAEGGKITLYVGRDGRIVEIGMPREELAAE